MHLVPTELKSIVSDHLPFFTVSLLESVPDISVLTSGSFSCMPSMGQEIPVSFEEQVSPLMFSCRWV